MVRNISANGFAKISDKLGNEPIFILGFDWSSDNAPLLYADRDIASGGTFIPGKILDIGEVDNVVDITGSNSSQEVSVTLDDTDGTIKAIMDRIDVHKRAVSVYQYFADLDLSDKFLIFEGIITTPIQWNEGDRTVKLSIVSRLEAQEIGFSADQGQFPFIPKNMVGKPWPIIFGTPYDVPALQVTNAVTGTLLCGVDLIAGGGLHNSAPLGGDPSAMAASLALMSEQASVYALASELWTGVDDILSQSYLDRVNEINTQIANTVGNWQAQQDCALAARRSQVSVINPACNPVHILGGEDFPQNTDIVLNCKGALLFGRMVNDYFYISKTEVPQFMLTAAQRAYDSIHSEQCQTQQTSPPMTFDYRVDVPCGTGDFDNSCQIRRYGYIISTGVASNPTTNQIAQQFWAEAGTSVTIAPSEQIVNIIGGINANSTQFNSLAGANISLSSGQPITYIASITPGKVLAVKAYKQLHDSWDDSAVGQKQLVDLPSSYYTTSSVNYGPITATTIITGQLLSTSIDVYGNNEGWDDQLWVTFQSDIGPNIIDIMIYIIENWTNGNGAAPNLTYDPVSFATVREQLAPFPANFPVLEQKDTLTLLKEIAFQARCALWISEGKVYLKYLPAEPVADDTITVSDIVHQSAVTDLTRTEDIITKMFVTWRLSWANGNGETPDIITLTNNVPAYGTQRQSYDFYIYNQPDIVLLVATFWLIRKSNTWKHIQFKTKLNKLNLETFDTVNLSLPNYVADGDVKAVVTKASYDSLDNSISFECEVPVRSGEMEPYKFYWPSSLTAADIYSGTGSGGIADSVVGVLDIGYTGVIGVPGKPLNWRGEFQYNTQYDVNDAVLWNGGAYVCMAANYNQDPGNLTYWELITQIDQTQGGNVYVGGPNVIFFGGAANGASQVGDVGFTAQPLIAPSVFAQINNQPRPYVDLTLKYLSPFPAPPVPPMLSGATVLDIHKTKIIDSNNPKSAPGYLKSLIKKIDAKGVIYLNSGLSVSDGDQTHDAKFDFAFDPDGNIWGAGTAFLKDMTGTASQNANEKSAQIGDPGPPDTAEDGGEGEEVDNSSEAPPG